MTATVTVPETIGHLDWNPACEAIECFGGRILPATFHYIAKPCCGCHKDKLICNACADEIRKRCDSPCYWVCGHCWKYIGYPRDWVILEPLP